MNTKNMIDNDVTQRMPIKWISAGLTHTGKVRSLNEDKIFEKPSVGFWAVADGMGGHQIGDLASEKTINSVTNLPDSECISDIVEKIEAQLISANDDMVSHSQNHLNGKVMGSTFVGMVIKQNIGACLWVGDSRLYHFRNGSLEQLSRDHSQVEEMIEQGIISREESIDHPNRNIITRAVGAEPDLHIDLKLFNPRAGDTYLLCSDGLYTSITDEVIRDCLFPKDPVQCANLLLDHALKTPAKDNISLIVIKGSYGITSTN